MADAKGTISKSPRIEKPAGRPHHRIRRIFHFSFIASVLFLIALQASYFSFRLNIFSTSSPSITNEQCVFNSQRSETFDFRDLKSFSFVQDFDSSQTAQWNTRINNTVVLRPGRREQSTDLEVAISINASDAYFTENIRIKRLEDGLIITLPKEHLPGKPFECLDLLTVVLVRPGLQLTNIAFTAAVGEVVISEGLDLTVTETTIVVAAGKIRSQDFFDSSKTSIEIGSGVVVGNYSVFRTLEMHTSAGAVIADVIPRQVDTDGTTTAVLNVTSAQGIVHIEYPPASKTDIPDRPYFTWISTEAGSIRGRYLLGNKTAISTKTGSIVADILPLSAPAASELTTTSTAGNQKLQVLSPYAGGNGNIDSLQSSHITTAGQLTLEYPSTWEGFLYGESTVGRIHVEGDFQDVEKGSIGLVGQYVKARKGNGSSHLDVRTTLGSTFLVVAS